MRKILYNFSTKYSMKKSQLSILWIVLIAGIWFASYIFLKTSKEIPTITTSQTENISSDLKIEKNQFQNKNNGRQEFQNKRNPQIQQHFYDFQNIATRKNNNLRRMEERLSRIIELSEKVSYDSSKLRFYKKEIQKHKNEYHNIRPEWPIQYQEFINQRTGRQQRNQEMRKIWIGIQEEFIKLQNYIQTNFGSGI